MRRRSASLLGQRLTEILKQDQYVPMDVEKQVVAVWSATNGFADDVPVSQIRHYEAELMKFLDAGGAALLSALREKQQINDEVKGMLTSTLEEFKKRYSAQAKGARA